MSQNYTLFYDKLEKSNYFLESILKTLDEPTDGRLDRSSAFHAFK